MKKLWKKMCIPALAMGAVFILFRFVLFIGYVPTEFMAPTIPKGSYIVGTRILGELKMGDIIVFQHEGRLLVKHIAAIEGDMVDHKRKTLCVPKGKFYMLGDNRGNSIDSGSWEDPFISSGSVMEIVLGN